MSLPATWRNSRPFRTSSRRETRPTVAALCALLAMVLLVTSLGGISESNHSTVLVQPSEQLLLNNTSALPAQLGPAPSTINASTNSPCVSQCLLPLANTSLRLGSAQPCWQLCSSALSPGSSTDIPQLSGHARPDSWSTHNYVGVQYGNYPNDFYANPIYTSIYTPSGGPHYNDFYYEVLSAWDNLGGTAASYLQIGMSSAYCSTSLYSNCQNTDAWGLTASIGHWTGGSSCNPQTTITYSGNDFLYDLQPDATYSYEMTLWDSTYVSFLLYSGYGIGGTPLYNYTTLDSGTDFKVFLGETLYYGSVHCTFGGFTDYQEVWNIAGTMSVPQWNFDFIDTYGGATLIGSSDWTNDSGPLVGIGYPSQGYIYDLPANYQVRIDNEVFGMYFPSTVWEIVAPGGTWSASPGNFNAAGGPPTATGPFCSGTTCPYSMSCTGPTGYYSYSYGWSPGWIPNGNDAYSVTMSSSASPGLYYSACTLTETGTSSSEWSNWIFYTYVT